MKFSLCLFLENSQSSEQQHFGARTFDSLGGNSGEQNSSFVKAERTSAFKPFAKPQIQQPSATLGFKIFDENSLTSEREVMPVASALVKREELNRTSNFKTNNESAVVCSASTSVESAVPRTQDTAKALRDASFKTGSSKETQVFLQASSGINSRLINKLLSLRG